MKEINEKDQDMKTIVLISCVKTKRPIRSKARDLYTSTWYKLAYEYAQRLKPDEIYILSAKHGLVNPEQELEPYNLTFCSMKTDQKKSWARKVLKQLEGISKLHEDHFIFLASEKYRKYLIKAMTLYEIPMEGLRQGEQLSWLKERLKS